MRQINLLPEEVKRTEKERINKNLVIFGAGLTFLVVASIHFLLAWRVDSLKNALKQSDAVRKNPGLSQLQKEINQLEKERERYVKENKALLEILTKHLASPSVLKVLSEAASGRVWFIGLSIDVQKETCRINGKSFNTQLVSEFMLELKRSSCFKKIDLTSMEKQSAPEGKDITFSITCEFE